MTDEVPLDPAPGQMPGFSQAPEPPPQAREPGTVVFDDNQPWMRDGAWKEARAVNQQRAADLARLGMRIGFDMRNAADAQRVGSLVQTLNNRFELFLRMFLSDEDRLEYEKEWQATLARMYEQAATQQNTQVRKLTIANSLRIKPD